MYYKVEAKCGHVGKNKFISKLFFVEADSGKEAANKVRFFPRVKHNRKDAILNCTIINKDEFLEGIYLNSLDPYFFVSSKQEQNLLCKCIYSEIDYEKINIKYKNIKNKFKLKNKLLQKNLKLSLKEALRYE